MARGDHIRVKRWRGLYSHHGIDMGDGTVIHLPGEPFRRGDVRICRTSINEFLAGGRAVRVAYGPEAWEPEAAAAAAEALLARPGYCLLRFNCEHFATYCKTGRATSRQVRRVLTIGGATAGAACALVLGVAATRRSRKLRETAG
jgi:hypothetical protein